MGGAVALKVHLKQPHAWDGAILVAPMCKVIVPDLDVGVFVAGSLLVLINISCLVDGRRCCSSLACSANFDLYS